MKTKQFSMTREELVALILERVETVLLEQGLVPPTGTDPAASAMPQGPGGGGAGGGMDDLLAPDGVPDDDGGGGPMADDPAVEDEKPLLSLEDLESMDQPDARKTLLAGLQSGGEEHKTTADLVAAILGKPTAASADGTITDPADASMPPSEELQQTASDVAAISGLSIQERKALKESFKTYLSLSKKNKKI